MKEKKVIRTIEEARLYRCKDCPSIVSGPMGIPYCDQGQLPCQELVLCREWDDESTGNGTAFIGTIPD